MKKENMASMGTIIVSLLAKPCCIGPALFVVLGTSIGIFGKLSFLNSISSYLLGMAFLMLSYSFWKLYLRKADCTCQEDKRARRISRRIFWLGFGVFSFAVSFQKLVLWIYG
jgi:hypothetical protein